VGTFVGRWAQLAQGCYLAVGRPGFAPVDRKYSALNNTSRTRPKTYQEPVVDQTKKKKMDINCEESTTAIAKQAL